MAERKHRRVIQQPDRRANRTILVRTLILLAVFGVAAFVPLFIRLWQLQIRDFGTYQSGAVENQTADTTVAAQRGAITDRNGEVLAMSAPGEVPGEGGPGGGGRGAPGLPGAHQRPDRRPPGRHPGPGGGGHPGAAGQDPVHV